MMTMEERRKVLDMVAGGKLTAAEAAELFSSSTERKSGIPDTEDESAKATGAEMLKKPEQADQFPEPRKEERPRGDTPRWLHIQVDDLRSGKRKVSVNIPLRIVKFGLKLGQGAAPNISGVDWDELSAAIAGGDDGVLVDVQDEEDGERVQIYVD